VPGHYSALFDGENLDLAVAHRDNVARGFEKMKVATAGRKNRRIIGAQVDTALSQGER
jgi:hypothetical protein